MYIKTLLFSLHYIYKLTLISGVFSLSLLLVLRHEEPACGPLINVSTILYQQTHHLKITVHNGDVQCTLT